MKCDFLNLGKRKEFTGTQKVRFLLGFVTYLLQKPDQIPEPFGSIVTTTNKPSSGAFRNKEYLMGKDLIFWMRKSKPLA